MGSATRHGSSFQFAGLLPALLFVFKEQRTAALVVGAGLVRSFASRAPSSMGFLGDDGSRETFQNR